MRRRLLITVGYLVRLLRSIRTAWPPTILFRALLTLWCSLKTRLGFNGSLASNSLASSVSRAERVYPPRASYASHVPRLLQDRPSSDAEKGDPSVKSATDGSPGASSPVPPLPFAAQWQCPGCTSDVLRLARVYPMSTSKVAHARYNNNLKVVYAQSRYNIEPMTREFAYDTSLPAGWAPQTHPEGALYFYHERRKLYTQANLFDRVVAEATELFATQIDDASRTHLEPISDSVECVLLPEMDKCSGLWKCSYYMVDHKSRILFWLNRFDASPMIARVAGVTSAAHVAHELEYHYWMHWGLFPYGHQLSQPLIDELTSILVHARYDTLSSPTSSRYYGVSDLQAMLECVNNLSCSDSSGRSACVLGRMMAMCAHERFLNFAGQPCARLSIHQSVYCAAQYAPSTVFRAAAALLMGAPAVHVRKLLTVWVDGAICQRRWVPFVGTLTQEWERVVVLSTIILSVNMALLAIPTVDTGPRVARTPVQILTYTSVASSLGSVVAGLLLIRHNIGIKGRGAADDVHRYLHSSARAVERLATLHALPYAGLMWSMLTFTAAFACMCLLATSAATRTVVAAMAVVVLFFVLWLVLETRDSGERAAQTHNGETGFTDRIRTCVNAFGRQRGTRGAGDV